MFLYHFITKFLPDSCIWITKFICAPTHLALMFSGRKCCSSLTLHLWTNEDTKSLWKGYFLQRNICENWMIPLLFLGYQNFFLFLLIWHLYTDRNIICDSLIWWRKSWFLYQSLLLLTWRIFVISLIMVISMFPHSINMFKLYLHYQFGLISSIYPLVR